MTQPHRSSNAYAHWIEERRRCVVPEELAEHVMTDVLEHTRKSHLERQDQDWWTRVTEYIEQRRSVRWAVCCVALLVGGLPYWFMTHAASF